MSKKLILILVVVVFLSKFNLAQADVVISEVKISPIEDRLIKLYNDGSSAVDLTGWYIQRKTQTGASFGSLVSKTYFENKKIEQGGYFLISRSLDNSDIILGSLTLTESNAIQIKNSEGAVVDKVCWGDVNDCSGNNLPNPSPGQSILITGQASATAVSTDANQGDESLAQDIAVTPSPKAKISEEPAIKAKILVNTLAFTGEPLSIKTNVTGFSNESVVLGRAYWNFGDGASLEQINNFEKFQHIYYYPGEYVLSLEYYQNSFSKTPETSGKVIIKVVPTSVVISKVGDAKDFFIELSNNAPSDIDISGWIINANGKIFVLPKNSVIISKRQMTISGKITGFAYGDQYNLKLFSGTGEQVFNYSPGALPVKILAKSPTPVKVSTATQPIQASALAINSQNPESPDGPYSSPIIPVVSAVFIGTSAYGVYFIRRKKTASVSAVGNDFEILDE